MNREIKFRVWKNNTMLQVGDGVLKEIYFDENNWNEDKDGVLMQYIGLKDKNGKEIYEGDIIKTPLSHMFRSNIYEVKYHQNRFTPDDICDGDVEIIGNIFENPNLPDNTSKI